MPFLDDKLKEISEILTQISYEHGRSSYQTVSLTDPESIGVKFFKVVDELINFQKRNTKQRPSISTKIPAFLRWLKENHVNIDEFPITIQSGLDEGCGLIATRPIQKQDLIITIPKNLIISTSVADEVGLKNINVEHLERMPSVKLAVYLCLETQKKISFWKPYLDILPRNLSLPLFWSTEEILCLRGSAMYGMAIQQSVTTMMQYFHIYNSLLNSQFSNECRKFTYEEYRWAVGIIMSRQNFVPLNGTVEICLIPLWDMFNHTNGDQITTFYNKEENAINSFAISDYQVGEQVFMFYGFRPNQMFLLYQGFVYPENIFDAFSYFYNIINIEDGLYEEKLKFLTNHKIPHGRLILPKSDDVIDWPVMVAARTAKASPSQFQTLRTLENPLGKELSLSNEVDALEYLTSIITWVEKTRKESLHTFDPSESIGKRLANQFLGCEQKIIEDSLKKCSAYRSSLRKREKRAKQRAKKKVKKEEEIVLQAACNDLD